jgi:DNA-binding GntR family transcriptional regulator
VRVASIDENDIAEVYCLRLLLEPLVVGLTAENISEGEIIPLIAIVDEADKLTSLDDMPFRRKINREFHMGISRCCGSSTLRRLHEIVWNKYPDWMLYEGLYRDPESLGPRLQLEIDEHRALLGAISNRNVDLAKQIVTSHIKIMKRDLIEVFNISGQVLEEKQRQMSL